MKSAQCVIVDWRGDQTVNREEAAVKLKQWMGLMALMVVVTAVVIGFPLKAVLAQTPDEPETGDIEVSSDVLEYRGTIVICIGVLVAAGSVAAAYAVAKVGSAALGAVTERPEMMGRALIFVGLAEGIAIYGLLMAILLYGKLG